MVCVWGNVCVCGRWNTWGYATQPPTTSPPTVPNCRRQRASIPPTPHFSHARHAGGRNCSFSFERARRNRTRSERQCRRNEMRMESRLLRVMSSLPPQCPSRRVFQNAREQVLVKNAGNPQTRRRLLEWWRGSENGYGGMAGRGRCLGALKEVVQRTQAETSRQK